MYEVQYGWVTIVLFACEDIDNDFIFDKYLFQSQITIIFIHVNSIVNPVSYIEIEPNEQPYITTRVSFG